MFKGTYQLTEGQREPPQLNWAGEPIREGEGYGGRPENILAARNGLLRYIVTKIVTFGAFASD